MVTFDGSHRNAALDMAIPYFGEEVSGLHGAAPSMGSIDEVETMARPRQLAVLHRIP
jgi:hypothetical protein